MKACIVAVGSELLTPFRVDTNSLAITERLNAIGYDVRLKAVVGDDVDELARVLAAALGTVDLIVTTGGLGPTEDDITRDAVARVLDAAARDATNPSSIAFAARFAERGMTMPEINRRQAMVPRGATVLENPNGTAPGLWLERGRHRDSGAAGTAARDDADARRRHRGAAAPARSAAPACSGACSRSPAARESDVDAPRAADLLAMDDAAPCRSPRRFSRCSGRSSCT